MIMQGIKAVIAGFQAVRGNARTGRLVGVKRAASEVVEPQECAAADDRGPANNDEEVSLQGGRFDDRNQTAATLKTAIPNSPTTSAEILLVTPVWNDSARLAGFGGKVAEALRAFHLPVRWIIADDGSRASEHAKLEQLRDEFALRYPAVEVYFAPRHHGKGAVVREAWALSPTADWLAFVDADGSVTAEEMLELVARAVSENESVLGIRKRTATTRIVESVWRGVFHRGFLLAVHFILDLQCEDPQCGAKVLRGEDYRTVAANLREPGLAFDSELLSALKRAGAEWLEVPVNWIEKPGGTVKPLRDAWFMLAALFRIRKRLNEVESR